MIKYYAYAKKKFLCNSVYNFNFCMGIINTCLQIFVFWCIYNAIYGGKEELYGITKDMVTTNFVISLGLSTVFSIDEFSLATKVQDGSICNYFIRPVGIEGVLLAEDIGNVIFKFIFQFFPSLILAIATIGVLKPVSILNFILYLLSITLGFIILWLINFLIQTMAFWIINIWSLQTIKSVFINLFSGIMLPLWFMPTSLRNMAEATPLSSIYFAPLQIYLGQVNGKSILFIFLRQMVWIVFLYFISKVLLIKGEKRLIIQGG